MYDAVSGSLPAIGNGFLDWNEALYYESFKVEMVNTFPDLTNVSQITATAS